MSGGNAITPTWVMDLESRMSVATESEYARLSQNLWWTKLAKQRDTGARREIVNWMLSTALIRDQGKEGGNLTFDDLVAVTTEVEMRFAGDGLKLSRNQFEDTDGNGVDLAAQWSTDVGYQMAYWPQKQIVAALKDGENTTTLVCYDTKALFATDHPYNPLNVGLGTFRNIFTGAASGSYPGACPLDESVTADVALKNMANMMAYIATVKMPNGEDPRMLTPKWIFCGPKLYPRIVQLTSAKFLAQAATGGAASADVEALIAALGYATPIRCNELAGFESDTTFFVVCEQASTSQLGPLMYVQREPFSIKYYTGTGGGTGVDAILDRATELEWHNQGRNAVMLGLPHLIFKGKGS